MNLKGAAAHLLAHAPRAKRAVKSVLYHAGAFLSDKKNTLPGLRQVSSSGAAHNFGYYDQSPWSGDGRYLIYLAPENDARVCVSQEPTPILLYDSKTGTETQLTTTRVWNSQQGCMLQWLGPDFSSRILFNDFREGKYCAVIRSMIDGSERVLEGPVYTVSRDGKTAVSLDFSRLNTFRPGYGYCNLPDPTAREKAPDSPCMWRLDLETGVRTALPITYRQLSEWNPQPSMKEGYHKVNHLMLNPSGNRLMFIHRWIVNGVTHHRLLTCTPEGTELYLLLEDGMVSHNNWKDDEVILSYCYSKSDGNGYHILRDFTQEREILCPEILTQDGHPSYSPDGKYIVTDTYPDFKGKQRLYLIRTADRAVKKLGEVYSSPRYREEIRCDLHPRWSRDSRQICIDAAPGKQRQVFLCTPEETGKPEEKSL